MNLKLHSLKMELAAREAVGNLSLFTRQMWPIIEPRTEYKHNWHIDAIADHLTAVSKFDIKKLVIMLPPRHMKSILVSVMWPAWEWITRPHTRYLYSSYAASLSIQDAIKMRAIITSDRYRSRFSPEWTLSDDQDTKARFQNTEKGERISTSVDGVSTGIGGDHIVGDDLISLKDAESEPIRKEAVDHWLKVLSSRGNNPERHTRTLVMQRLHEKDPAGSWIAEDKTVEVLRLPAEYEPKSIHLMSKTSLDFKDPRTTEGELLWPTHFTTGAIETLKKDYGSRGWRAQGQQDPKPGNGGTFKRHWWKSYREAPMKFIEIVQFWDCAEEMGVGNDYSVCATWGRTEDGYYLLDMWRNKVEMPDLERAAKSNYEKWKPNLILIEKKSNGTALYQTLARETTLPVVPFSPGQRDKVVRASAATPTVEAGNCYLPDGAGYVEDYISEHESFPLGANDDMVDTTSMMVEHFSGRRAAMPRIRHL